jgi:hypothetical protein
MRRRLAAAVSTAAVLLAPAAADAAAPSRAQFIRDGDALCRQTRRELVPLRRRALAAQSLPEAKKWAAVTKIWSAQVTIQARFTTRFHAIGTPAGDRTARRLVAGLDRGLALARRVRNAFAARDTAALANALPAYVRHTVSLNQRIVAYGFTTCGR